MARRARHEGGRVKSTALFTKPARSRLSPQAKAPRPTPSISKGQTRDVDEGFERFEKSRMTAPRVTT